ncbi:hypothetical protein N7530_006035 [Penicillium desertorum]|uniref:Uncharacterized protein n=1 Tax=Penicillium desertorum TaxID=1303715 RepID=A0A9W9X2D2_9EURO|nr:hypothetical protein N7530_006035 [Penicillium desertorum]
MYDAETIICGSSPPHAKSSYISQWRGPVKGAGQEQSTCLMSPAYAYPTASSNPALSAYHPTAAFSNTIQNAV